MMENNVIVGLGELLWDVFPDRKVPGGAPANFADHVGQLGLPGCVVSAVGRDALGAELLNVLKSKELGSYVEEVPFPTGTVQVTLDDAGVPQYEICEGMAWDNIPFTDRLHELARRTRVVCCGSLAQRNAVSRETINRFLDALPADALKVFDINLRQHFYDRPTLQHALERSDVLKINDDEVSVVARLWNWQDKTEMEICSLLRELYGLDMVVLTKGACGSYVVTAHETSFLPTPKVAVVDTVGAGDSFTAAFLAGLLYGMDIRRAHRLAVDVSAYVCTCQGAMPVLPEAFVRQALL